MESVVQWTTVFPDDIGMKGDENLKNVSKESENLVTFALCLDYLNLTKFSALFPKDVCLVY